MPTKQENKTIQGKSHKNHKYNQRNAKIQGNKLKNIYKKKVHINRAQAGNQKRKGHWKLIAMGTWEKT
jgi:hypothetical protein